MHQRPRRRIVPSSSLRHAASSAATATKQPLWVSRNKVLSGGNSKKPHARNPNFDSEETKVLISLWGDPKLQKALITAHKKQPVIMKIAEAMQQHGYSRSAEELNTRIKNLKCFYNRIKKERDAGLANAPNWKHYDAMDEIMNRPIFGNIGTQQHHLELYEANKKQPGKNLLTPMDAEDDDDDLEQLDFNDEEDPDITVKEELMSTDEDDNSIRPEDLLQVEGHNLVADIDIDENELIIPKTEPESEDVDVDYNPPPFNITSVSSIHTSEAPSSTTAESAAATVSSNPAPPVVTTTQNKISLVPANILLKPQTMNFPQQKFILQNTNPMTATATSSAGGGMPMKFVFLKSSQPGGGNTITVSPANSLKTVNSTPTLLTTAIQAKPQLPQLQPKPTATSQPFIFQTQLQPPPPVVTQAQKLPVQQPVPAAPKPKLLPSNFCINEPKDNKDRQKQQHGFRSLLNQLVQLQSTSVMISRQRLGVEKQRLAVERTLGEQMILSLQAIQKLMCQPKAAQQSHATTSDQTQSYTTDRPRRAKKPRLREATSDEDFTPGDDD